MPTPGLNFYQSMLLLPPCIWITSHTHPQAWEVNQVIQGKMNFWMTNYANNAKVEADARRGLFFVLLGGWGASERPLLVG